MKKVVAGMVLSALFAAAPARAEKAGADHESNLVIQQAGAALMVGALASGAGLYLMDQSPDGAAGALGAVLLFASPLAATATVCGIGSTSDKYEARGACWPTIGVGMATVPAVFAAAMFFGGRASNGKLTTGQNATLAALWIGLPPLLATTGWHLFKRPKTPVLAPAHPDRPVAFAATAPRTGLSVKGQMLFELASAAF